MNYIFHIPRIQRRGQTLLVTIVFLMAISLTLVLGIGNPILRHRMNSASFDAARQTALLGEAGLEDVLYRLKNNIPVSNSEILTLNGRSVETSIVDTPEGKTITSETDIEKGFRKYEVKIVTDEGVSFPYALQSGNGGFVITGGSTINGNIYSTGSIVGSGGSRITGSATAANSAALTPDQSNRGPLSPTQSIDLGRISSVQDIAQSFVPSQTGPLNKIGFYIRRTSSLPGSITVRLIRDINGTPQGVELDSASLAANLVGTTYGWVEVVFPQYVELDAGQKYWVVLDRSTDSSRYYTLGANTSYGAGEARVGTYGGTWSITSPEGLDIAFEVVMGGLVGLIRGNSWDFLQIGGDAWANTIQSTNTTGTLYCQSGSMNNSKVCNTTRSDPAPQSYAISDSNIQTWKNSVESSMSGGTTHVGNLTIGWQGTTTTSLRRIEGNLTINGGGIAQFDALEVTGNVTISNGARLIAGPLLVHGDMNVGFNGATLKGNMWVKGRFTLGSGASISLSPLLGPQSAVLVVDGVVNITGGGTFAGSGQSGSYPIVLTTSECNGSNCSGLHALSIGSGAGAVVLYAPYGSLHMTGGTAAKALTAHRIHISSGASIVYDSGLSDISIASTQSGSWNVISWKEIE